MISRRCWTRPSHDDQRDTGETFERFTDRARRVLVLAQEEARLLNHSFIGTEHLLLGIIRVDDGVAARALEALGISLEAARAKVEETIGVVGPTPFGSPPFTPRAKKVLELALREALQLGHADIGTEHMLLGLVREGEGVAAQVLISLGADLGRVRQQVIWFMSGQGAEPDVSTEPASRDELRARPATLRPEPWCSLCGRELWEFNHFVSGGSGAICSECIEGAHEALGQADPSRQEVFLPPRVFGNPPDEQAVEAIASLLGIAFSWGASIEEISEAIEGFDELHPFLVLVGERFRIPVVGTALERIRFVDDSHAAVQFRLIFSGGGSVPRQGHVHHHENRWRVDRQSVAAMLVAGGIRIPPIDLFG
jgi:hypothetical protein